MPAPTNISAATAVELGPLPNTITQNVNDSGTTYTVWYKYTAQPGDTTLGIFAFGDLIAYTAEITVYSPDGVTLYPPSPIGIPGFFADNVPIQMPVIGGQVYYFKITSTGGNVSPANLSITAQLRVNAPAPIGSLVVPSDDGSPTTILSAADGSVLDILPLFTGGGNATDSDYGAMLHDDTMITYSDLGAANDISIFSPTFAVVADVGNPIPTAGSYVFSSNKINTFYVGGPGGGGNTYVKTFSAAGTLGSTWNLGVAELTGMAPNPAETILYTAGLSVGHAVKRWDLIGSTFLTDLVGGVPNYSVGKDIIVLSDGSIILNYNRAGVNAYVVRVDPSGTLLNTYAVYVSGQAVADNRMAVADDDPNSFWFWSKVLATGISTFQNIRASDGVVLNTFASMEFENGIYAGVPTATPIAYFGHSFSCPLLFRRTPYTPPPPPGIKRVPRPTVPPQGTTPPDLCCPTPPPLIPPAPPPPPFTLGFTTSYTLTSGVVPVHPDPVPGELLAGKNIDVWVEVDVQM